MGGEATGEKVTLTLSQQSISTERQPSSITRRYMSGVDVELSWPPSRKVLCEHATK